MWLWDWTIDSYESIRLCDCGTDQLTVMNLSGYVAVGLNNWQLRIYQAMWLWDWTITNQLQIALFVSQTQQ